MNTPETDLLQRVLAQFVTVRPLLVAAATLPFVPARWREQVTQFVTALDHLVFMERGFKMGKDL